MEVTFSLNLNGYLLSFSTQNLIYSSWELNQHTPLEQIKCWSLKKSKMLGIIRLGGKAVIGRPTGPSNRGWYYSVLTYLIINYYHCYTKRLDFFFFFFLEWATGLEWNTNHRSGRSISSRTLIVVCLCH